jgi:hypothetical protein
MSSAAQRERPIMFSAEMVRAIIDGRKSQTRRLYKPRSCDRIDSPGGPLCSLPSPYGSPGDHLWVKETWSHDAYGPYYRATEVAPDTLRWKPSIFMPRWASRITLEITEVHVQRLQEISGDDAAAEGVTFPRCDCDVCCRSSVMCPADASAHIDEFATLWDSINGKPRVLRDDDGDPVTGDDGMPVMVAARSWASNPWVWAITFRRLP